MDICSTFFHHFIFVCVFYPFYLHVRCALGFCILIWFWAGHLRTWIRGLVALVLTLFLCYHLSCLFLSWTLLGRILYLFIVVDGRAKPSLRSIFVDIYMELLMSELKSVYQDVRRVPDVIFEHFNFESWSALGLRGELG